MTTYRWNTTDAARAYDAAAETIHPHYSKVQAEILALLPIDSESCFRIIDLGGGSGRLMGRILERWPNACGQVIDQSAAFLALAEERLENFADRISFTQMSLQEGWSRSSSSAVDMIVSTSAIHHLQPDEKQTLFRQCYEALSPGGTFINGDECRPESDDEYLQLLQKWGEHMKSAQSDGRIPTSFRETLAKWHQRNITEFGCQKTSGDDCHETVDTQLEYLRATGFVNAKTTWHHELWAVMQATID